MQGRLTEVEELPFDSSYKPKFCDSLAVDTKVTFNQMLTYNGVCNKLGQHEDKEDEMGIEILFLLDVISNPEGIWKKYPNGEIVNTRAILSCEGGYWRIYDKEWIFNVKDYGKTWAKTKVELL